MKYLKINLQSIKIKGDEDDLETLQTDLYEKLTAMIESETLTWEVSDDEDEDDED